MATSGYLQQQDIGPAFLAAFFLAGAFLATFLAVAFMATFLAGAFLATFFATFLATVVPPLKVRGLAEYGNSIILKFQ